MFDIWAENVDRLCSMLCSSPMSTKTLSYRPTLHPSEAGMNNPHLLMRTVSPSVLRATVLPPVFGPVMTTTK